ncbi:60S ribosomal protein L9 / uL6 [Leishmania donovani]|uniref:60S_ribosomal_protein_L9_-_putative n=4 Tax=Leishmania donovani species complex TaxID=38574 RepID=A0A6L0XK89_LEIIN|nr:putative 60S ribosomal protein L9 [Leishmania infantum JPCM5]AYU81139.1 60S ribosomal protein L9, putative [Leishmania donovani]CAC9515955.1 60S_ribosomal_protein_L9_-_putative [Leishmania infantum]TPP43199.1 Ribosomal protein L6 family protein [Leishmania donovani]TPP45885.1 Ribosomal protein L6 family protein [Leishmania donovani]CAJ1991132.1 60S ribosomal protein L9 / uL6 [Leishmania donovani]|eukprot:XP_001467241.2 putative 60S ribosomal protein L9 [Leishmania infantum JPCM5]
MVKVKSLCTLQIPEGVTVDVKGRKVTVTGKRGTLTKDLTHLQLDLRVDKKNRTFTVIRWFGSKIPIACLNTTKAHVQNMITGVTKGYRFKVRCAYAHFPINVSVDGQNIEVRNFLGEKRVRRQLVPSSVKVSQTDPSKVKDEIIFDGNDLEQVSREAAVLHQMCLVKKKDIRKFLDGIYVQTKTNIEGAE